MENGNTTYQNLCNATKAAVRWKFIAIVLPQEIRKISNKQPNFMPKQSRKRRTKEAQS